MRGRHETLKGGRERSGMKVTFEQRYFAVILLIGLAVVAFEPVWAQTPSTPASGTPTAAVVREVLSETQPVTAPGEVFQLVRYTIPPDLTLAAHTHPGIQMNLIEAGTLTYFVVADGEISVTRADGSEETFGPGESTTLAAGDSFIEPARIVHYGGNLGAEPVEIVTASLLAAEEPAATLVEPATPAATPASQ